jgi:hypothetical protein
MLKVWISIWRRICFCFNRIQAKEFEKAVKKAMDMVDVFPSASVLLLFRLAYQLAQKKAKEMLEMGLDYLVDDNALTINFNIQLGEACHGLGDEKKKDFYFLKPINY